jgi:hypothetical protein
MRFIIPLTSWAVAISAQRRTRRPFRLRFGLGAMLLSIALLALLSAIGTRWYHAQQEYWQSYYVRMEGLWLEKATRADRNSQPSAAAQARKLAAYNSQRKREYQR